MTRGGTRSLSSSPLPSSSLPSSSLSSTSVPATVALKLSVDDGFDSERIAQALARSLRVPQDALPAHRVLRRGIDARGGRVRIDVLLALGGGPAAFDAPSADPLGNAGSETRLRPKMVGDRPHVVIVGSGPAGLFCAYRLACQGIRSTVLDRGKPVQPRRRDLKGLNQDGRVDADSNYCFGEGGAGTYSDGKLYTRATKRGPVRDVLEILALHGAPEAILVDARPHIGSNKLPKVVTALRERLEQSGVAFHFGARVVAFDIDASGNRNGQSRCIRGVTLADGSMIEADAVVLATGHSARDIFELATETGLVVEAKDFAMGVRIEHPQALIDRIQFGKDAGHPNLGSAAYRLTADTDSTSVFSFCMCPGGWVVPASTERDALVVNGMSLSKRNSPFANSGLVAAVPVRAIEALGLSRGPMAGIEVQRQLERTAFAAGGGMLRAPATRVSDFLAKRPSSTLPASSYIPGLVASDISEVLDSSGLPLTEALRQALGRFGKQLRGFLSEEGVLIGVETRTSSPVRIVRDADSLEALNLRGLYPAGEGAGYAGGIVSAALDGMRIGSRIARRFGIEAETA